MGVFALGRPGDDDCALFDGGVEVFWDEEPGSDGLEVGGVGGGEGDEAGVCVGGFSELGCLGDVFSGDKFWFEDFGELETGEGCEGGSAVGCAVGVGDGEALEFWIGEGGEGWRWEVTIFAGPKDEGAAGVDDRRGGVAKAVGCDDASGVGEAGVEEAPGVAEIGGEEEVKGCAVLNLGGESCGGLVGGLGMDSRDLMELIKDGRENWLKVGGGGDSQRGLLGFCNVAEGKNGDQNQGIKLARWYVAAKVL